MREEEYPSLSPRSPFRLHNSAQRNKNTATESYHSKTNCPLVCALLRSGSSVSSIYHKTCTLHEKSTMHKEDKIKLLHNHYDIFVLAAVVVVVVIVVVQIRGEAVL